MKIKVLVELRVPEIGEIYSVYLPSNKRIGTILVLLNKALNEITSNEYPLSESNMLVNSETGLVYSKDVMLIDTDIRNGSKLTIMQ